MEDLVGRAERSGTKSISGVVAVEREDGARPVMGIATVHPILGSL